MFIEVPTMDIKFMSEPMGMFCEEHVNYFTFQSLYNLMKAAGYRLVNAEISMGFDKRIPAGWPAMDTLWEKDHMAPSILPAVSSAMLLTSYIEANEVILKKVREKIRSIPHGERLAIWGTGHHVSMLLGNTDLSKKNIVCFYDSDQRKYDWTMVGKEIKSFNSCDIDEHEIDAILIGSYIYQQEIYDQLKNYREMCEIYMLY